jgi:hypothetical protein
MGEAAKKNPARWVDESSYMTATRTRTSRRSPRRAARKSARRHRVKPAAKAAVKAAAKPLSKLSSKLGPAPQVMIRICRPGWAVIVENIPNAQGTRFVCPFCPMSHRVSGPVRGFRKLRRAQWVKLRRVEE